MRKYLCPICKKDVGEYGTFCCGRHVITPAGTSNMMKWGFFIIILPMIFFGLVMITIFSVGQFRSRRDATRVVDTGLTLPITVTNTTVIINANGDVTHYITPESDFRAVYRNEVRVIDTNVRSIEHVGQTTFYIKNDNSLWGFGSNANGRLGTGTGIDVEEPVLILENVAKLFHVTSLGSHVYAIGTDGVLWMWGQNDFSPVQITEDAVAIIEEGTTPLIQKSNGLLYRLASSSVPPSEGEFFRTHPFAILDFASDSTTIFNARRPRTYNLFYIDNNNMLIQWAHTANNRRRGRFEIAHDVQSVFGVFSNTFTYNLLIIDSEGILWGYGNNRNGELGDGTKAPRDETPVRVAENVVCAGRWYYLTADSVLWIWDNNNPTPEAVLNNVAIVNATNLTRGFNASIIFNDGTVITNFERWSQATNDARRESFTHDGIKMPETIVFTTPSS